MKRLEAQTPHAALIVGNADDRARQEFAFALRNVVTGELMPSNRIVFDRRAAPDFARAEGRPPENPKDIRAAMEADSWYRFYISARRTSQELIWASVVPAVEAAAQASAPAAAPAPAGGTLTLDPGVVVPGYVAALDIHCMPGGYAPGAGMSAGAIYDRGVYLYMSGLMGGLNDAVGQLGVAWLKRHAPGFAPRRILDIGCGVGHATLPWCDAYPDAEVHGIDVGAALLRYGHARAEGLGRAVQFSQRNAEATGFADESFDLVTSSIVLHETSGRGLPAIFAECRRLLRPGGIMLHIDQPSFRGADPWGVFLQENETYYNNEPFWRRYRQLDLAELAVAAGFARETVVEDLLTADVVRQSQNNESVSPESAAAKARGFGVLLARVA